MEKKKLASDESPMTPNKIKHRNNSGITLTVYAFANFRFVIIKFVAKYDGDAMRVAPAIGQMPAIHVHGSQKYLYIFFERNY